ncbi:MAG TPA: FAD-dependent oxidoreductase [Gemmatimonadales bacterium]|jgi:glycine/D-amino acid oxidase-like deaminating enzyme|nr:FAD-dependent oxidoreductase [Gemmatimonadales bacterium]
MDLTTGVPFWLVKDGLTATYPKLAQDRRCDVAIIGGGITGAMVGQRFAEEGFHTVLLEGREMGYGSTGASTALLQYELDTHLTDLGSRYGAAAAGRCYQLCAEAIEGIGRLVAAIGADADFRTCRSLYLASHRRDVRALEREWRARRQLGLEVDLLAPGDIRSRFSFERPAALLTHLAGEVDPLRLTHALLAAGLRDGLEIYDRTGVARYQSDRKGVLLETADGWRIRARKAVFATGYNLPPFFPRRAVRLTSTFVMATAPLTTFEGWGEDRCLIWETARPYLYARTTRDGRAILGGADLPFKGARKLERVQDRQTERLAGQFAHLFPGIRFEVDWSWAGAFAASEDGLPYVGTAPDFPNGLVALGHGANGVVWAYVAARVLADLFVGRDSPDAALFRIGR